MNKSVFKPLWSLLLLGEVLLLGACEIEDPLPYGRVGDQVRFSGYDWYVKTGPSLLGPGPNLFSNRPEDVFVDAAFDGFKLDGAWYSTEVVGLDTVGYGVYTWVISGDYENIPENTVLGLFTWNTESFQEEANSEVDIEFAKWDNPAAKTLHMSVQPVNFGPYYPERTHEANTDPGDLVGVTTHQFSWTDSLIVWKSWKGEGTAGELIAEWSFDNNNPGRVKNENGLASRPIVIPAPLNNTNVRMNHGMLFGIPPADGQEHEAIIRSFQYEAY